ncbi:hypothetical protein SDC9_107349 [bioreactor metagenome]|uniref:Uncharacterized protein n=1 Tax=bioreactor metagenome TaxID=1076179 RepID=A0A645B605_9ZZZZ
MKIEMSILYDFLAKKYNIKTNINNFNKNQIDGYLFFNEDKLMENYVYIIKSHQLELYNEYKTKNMNFICIGRPEKNYKNNLCNIIYVPFKIDIFELFNFLQLIFNKIKSWDEKITNIIYSSMDVSKIFEVTRDILPFHMQLIDKDLFVIAKSDDLFFEKYPKIAPLDEINKMILEKIRLDSK